MVVASGSVLVRTEMIPLAGDRGRPGSVRGDVTGFSRKSRARLMYRCSTLDVGELLEVGRFVSPAHLRERSCTPEMLTFTYPAVFPTSGHAAKEHLRAFRERFFRRWGFRMAGIWKMEFQRRGAPHFHCYIGRPTSVGWKEFLEWARDAWFDIVGEGGLIGPSLYRDERHRLQGVRIDRQFVGRATSVRRLAAYFAKHNAKVAGHYQNVVPEGFTDVGRFWGVWVLKPQTVEIGLTTDQFVAFRRALVALQRSQKRRCKAPSRLIGLWSMSHDGFRLADQLLGCSSVASVQERTNAPPTLRPVTLTPV